MTLKRIPLTTFQAPDASQASGTLAIGGNVVFGAASSGIGISTTAINIVPGWPENFAAPVPPVSRGSTTGFVTGGGLGPPTYAATTTIDSYPFASDTPATDRAELTTTATWRQNFNSSTHGYSGAASFLDKFSFTSAAPAANVADPIMTSQGGGGYFSPTDGYFSAGYAPGTDNIVKHPFSSDDVGTDVGELSQYGDCGAVSSDTHGYHCGGEDTNGSFFYVDTIEKFSFSDETSVTDVGELSIYRNLSSGTQSDTNGYVAAGVSRSPGPSKLDVIDKFPFSSDTPATDIAELYRTSSYCDGIGASSTSGYSYLAGDNPANDTIQKWTHSSDAPATDVGEMSTARRYASANHV